MTHTPGPWVASEGVPSDVWHVDMPGRAWSVVVARHESDADMSVEEVQANARLIAAAPAMLAALKEAEQALEYFFSRFPVGTFGNRRGVVRDAIAKAEGGDA